MRRCIERIFEAAGIEEELSAYNPLIPNGRNLKATFMLEYTDAEARRVALQELHGIEERVWLCAGDEERVWAVADEDLERSTDAKTSAVHFFAIRARRCIVSGDQRRRTTGHRHRSPPVPLSGGTAGGAIARRPGRRRRLMVNIRIS